MKVNYKGEKFPKSFYPKIFLLVPYPPLNTSVCFYSLRSGLLSCPLVAGVDVACGFCWLMGTSWFSVMINGVRGSKSRCSIFTGVSWLLIITSSTGCFCSCFLDLDLPDLVSLADDLLEDISGRFSLSDVDPWCSKPASPSSVVFISSDVEAASVCLADVLSGDLFGNGESWLPSPPPEGSLLCLPGFVPE